MRWHYSKRMPAGKNFAYGVWENDKFIGSVIYGGGSGGSTIGTMYGLKVRYEMAELTRVALGNHKTPVTQIIAITLKMLKKSNPKLRLITSYADARQGHLGIIYQAGGWIFTGGRKTSAIVIRGKKFHTRSVGQRFSSEYVKKVLDPNANKVHSTLFHYLMPLDKKMRKGIIKLSKEYPKSL